MDVTVTHVEAGASTSLTVLTDQDIPILITIEDVWSYGEEPGHAVVSVSVKGPKSALLGEVVVSQATRGEQITA